MEEEEEKMLEEQEQKNIKRRQNEKLYTIQFQYVGDAFWVSIDKLFNNNYVTGFSYQGVNATNKPSESINDEVKQEGNFIGIYIQQSILANCVFCDTFLIQYSQILNF